MLPSLTHVAGLLLDDGEEQIEAAEEEDAADGRWVFLDAKRTLRKSFRAETSSVAETVADFLTDRSDSGRFLFSAVCTHLCVGEVACFRRTLLGSSVQQPTSPRRKQNRWTYSKPYAVIYLTTSRILHG